MSLKSDSSSPPSASPTHSRHRLSWAAAAYLVLALGGLLLWGLISSSLFTGWEISRLSQRGEITLNDPLTLDHSIRHYLNGSAPGLIQQHRLNNPERSHLLSVKQLLDRLKITVVLLGALGLVICYLTARQTGQRLRQTLHPVTLPVV